jgi:hypothetical protein
MEGYNEFEELDPESLDNFTCTGTNCNIRVDHRCFGCERFLNRSNPQYRKMISWALVSNFRNLRHVCPFYVQVPYNYNFGGEND